MDWYCERSADTAENQLKCYKLVLRGAPLLPFRAVVAPKLLAAAYCCWSVTTARKGGSNRQLTPYPITPRRAAPLVRCTIQVRIFISPLKIACYYIPSPMCSQRRGIPGAVVPGAFRRKRDAIHYARKGPGGFQQHQDVSGVCGRNRSGDGPHVRHPTAIFNLGNEHGRR